MPGVKKRLESMNEMSSGEAVAHDVVWVDDGARAMPTQPSTTYEFTIGELAKEFGVTLRALRFYENKGLIAPRRQGLSRFYSQADRDRLALILKGKKLGFTLSEIRQMVSAEQGQDSKALKLSQEKCLEQIALLERQQADIEEGLAELRRIYTSLSAKIIEVGSGSAGA
jgi:DNA-binding transcriptional MerR regulator